MADNAPSTQQIEQALGAGAVGFGVLATVLPRVFTAVYGLGSDPRTVGLTRLWGTRTAALGALFLTAETPQAKRRLSMAATAINSVDALLTARNGSLPARTRILGSLSSGAFAAAGGYALSRG